MADTEDNLDDGIFSNRKIVKDSEKDDDSPSFEDIIKGTDEEIIRSTSDTTDFVEREHKFRFVKAILIAVFVVALIIAFGYGVFSLMKEGNDEDTTRPVPSPTTSQSESAEPSSGSSSKSSTDLPLLSIIPNPIDVSESKASLSAADSAFVSSSGTSITFQNGKTVAAQAECSVTNPKEFCYAGTVRIGDSKTDSNVYFYKDIAHSRFFENAEDFKKVDVSGAVAAATMKVAVSSDNKEPVLVVVFNDMSGVMISSSDDLSAISGSILVK